MNKKIFIIILSIVIIISIFISWRIIVSPPYSLKQLKKAISRDDMLAFDKYVDLDRTADNAIDQIWQFYGAPASESRKSRWIDIRNEIGQSVFSVLKPNLKEIIKKEVYHYIISGKLENVNSQGEGRLASMLMKLAEEKINPENWESQSINYTKIKEDMAFLGLTYYDKSKQANFVVDIKMRNMQGYWQLIEITNIAQILKIFNNI
jgi:hypothetical protein